MHFGEMPRFLFHIINDIDVRDEEGQELTNLAMAHLVAIDAARELAATSVRQGKLNLNHRVDVEDEAGEVLLSVPFKDAIDLTM